MRVVVDWAFRLTRDHAIEDRPELATFRRQFEGYPAAHKVGAIVVNELANNWHKYRDLAPVPDSSEKP